MVRQDAPYKLAKTVSRAPKDMSQPGTGLPDGISRNRFARVQAEASLPEAAFRAYIEREQAKDDGDPFV